MEILYVILIYVVAIWWAVSSPNKYKRVGKKNIKNIEKEISILDVENKANE